MTAEDTPQNHFNEAHNVFFSFFFCGEIKIVLFVFFKKTRGSIGFITLLYLLLELYDWDLFVT